METGIVGLAQSGKTTVFNAVTRGKAQTGAHAEGGANVGVAKVPDPRLGTLCQIFQPRREVPAEVRYVDSAAPAAGRARGESRGEALGQLSKADALLCVVRAFPDESVPHPDGSVDAERDIASVELELVLADLAIVERRLERIETSLKAARPHEREAFGHEQALLWRLKEALERESPLRVLELSEEERRLAAGFQFLSAKPLLIVFNIGEEMLSQAGALEEEWRSRYRGPHRQAAVLCAKVEEELAQLEDADAEEFRTAMGIEEAALERIIVLSYELLGLVTFFTHVSDEVRAWSVPRGTPAVKAAGKIHSDMERGFIRAEVISFPDLERCDGIAEGRRQGLLHTEGKSYTVKDGDVITFLFNV